MAIYQLSRCVIDNSQHQLLVSGISWHIEPQVFDLLRFLVERGGEVVSHDALIESVWSGHVVSDSAISGRINAARKAVGDNGGLQAMIKTEFTQMSNVAGKEVQASTASLLVEG